MARALTCIAVALAILWGSQAAAQISGGSIDVETIVAKRIDRDNVYSVKFVCGTLQQLTVGPIGSSFAPARYRTAINIHNPESRSVQFTVKGVRTQSNFPRSAGPFIGTPMPQSLVADGGLELSCEDIMAFIGEANVDIF